MPAPLPSRTDRTRDAARRPVSVHHGDMSDSLAPGFIIAVPHLADLNFRHSVVLLLEQNADGALGVVVNHESPLLLKELCRDHSIQYSGDPGKRVRAGGPVQPEQGLVLYDDRLDDHEGRQVHAGLRVSASQGTLNRLCGSPGGRFQCFAGYAGWGPGQLDDEIHQNAWLNVPADDELVFDDLLDTKWERSIAKLGIDLSLLSGDAGHA